MKMKEITKWELSAQMKDGSCLNVVISDKAKFIGNSVIYKFEEEFCVTECAISLDSVSAISCTGYFTEEKK